MKNFLFIVLFITLSSCGADEEENSFLPNQVVNVQINMNLYPELQIIGNSLELDQNIGGIKGLIIYNTGTGYVAFDRACPHIALQECAKMNIEGMYMVCGCDNKRFQIIDGAPEDGNIQHAARAYIATKTGNILYIRN